MCKKCDPYGIRDSKYCKCKNELTEARVKEELSTLLNECLASYNQDYSFEVKNVDLKNMKLTVDFNIVVVDEDKYIGFVGY